jgi:hypothetical protein
VLPAICRGRSGLGFFAIVTDDETIETIHDITRKNFAAKPINSNAEHDNTREARTMLKPTLRFFIVPLGAICALASLSAQNTTPRAQRDTGSMFVHQQVVDCSHNNPAEVCVIPDVGETSAR